MEFRDRQVWLEEGEFLDRATGRRAPARRRRGSPRPALRACRDAEHGRRARRADGPRARTDLRTHHAIRRGPRVRRDRRRSSSHRGDVPGAGLILPDPVPGEVIGLRGAAQVTHLRGDLPGHRRGTSPRGRRPSTSGCPLPQTDRNQTIHRVTIDAPGPVTIGREPRFGNQCLHVRVESPAGTASSSPWPSRRPAGRTPGSDEPLSDEDRARYLAAEPLVPLDGPVRALALEATRGLATDAEKARAIYEKVVGHDEVRQDRAPAGAGGTPSSPAMRGGATAPTSTP